MAERYDFYVHDNRKITFNLTEPIMREDSGVTDFVFHIPKILNELEVSDWQWWLVFVNAKKEKYSIALTLSDDPERPLEFNTATYTVDYAMSIKAGSVQFALEAINAGTGGAIDNEWHTLTYETKVKETLQGNQAEYAETESDIISALIQEVRTKVNQLVGGATPTPAQYKAQMTDPQKVYLYIGSEPNEHAGHWYYHNGTTFVSGGVYGAGVTDAVPTQGSTNAVSSGGVYSALADKADKADTPENVTPEETDADFYLSDANGNVILELADGHIRTKHFDSSNINTETDTTFTEEGKPADSKAVGDAIDALQEEIDSIEPSGGTGNVDAKDSTESGIDLDFSDSRGNVIMRLKDGDVKTKNFDSANIKNPIETFSVSKTFVRGTVNTLTIAESFKKGEEIYFQLDDGSGYDDYGYFASYYQGNTLIESNRRGSNGFYRHIITEDCNSVGVTIASTEYANGTELTLYVYRKNGEVQPKIITVKADGTGMFQTLKSALESITNANHLTNPYVIEVYPGTYNTLAGYTDAEIRSADIGGGYTQDSMVGVKLTDGISIKGIGDRDEVILTAELNTSDYSSAVRGNISTLNIEGEGSVENVTIIGKNLRYCVHDDFVSPVNSHDKRVLRNLKFKGENLANAPLMTTYGAGMSAPRDYIIEDCDFGFDVGIHNVANHKQPCMILVNNCSGNRFYVTDYATSESDAVHRVIINNCNFQVIETAHVDASVSAHMAIEGVGNEYSIIKDARGDVYNLGMVDRAHVGLTKGSLVKRNANMSFSTTTDKAIAHGVCIGSDDNYSYIQRSGYISSIILGIAGLSVGDYVTVNSSGAVVSGGTSANAIGVVAVVDSDNVAYIKLML